MKFIAESYERMALCIILQKGLPLTAHVEIWTSCRIVREVALVIRPVPEEYTFQDEAQDTEEYEEERAEWVGQE